MELMRCMPNCVVGGSLESLADTFPFLHTPLISNSVNSVHAEPRRLTGKTLKAHVEQQGSYETESADVRNTKRKITINQAKRHASKHERTCERIPM